MCTSCTCHVSLCLLSGCVSLSVSERASSYLEADQCVTSQHRRSDEEETQVRHRVLIFALSHHCHICHYFMCSDMYLSSQPPLKHVVHSDNVVAAF